MNRYAIGDIHGGLQTFLALIRRLSPRHDDRVYLLGDYVDRGPDSKGVLDAIISMREAGCDVRPLLGNHDDMLLRSAIGRHDNYSQHWLKAWGGHTLKSFGSSSADQLPERYLNFLASLPLSLSDGAFFLAHAGLDMTKNDPVSESSPEQMLWGDAAYCGQGRDLGGVTLVTGHKVRTLDGIRASLATCHMQIDNGAFTGFGRDHGNLVAINLDTRELYLQPWLDGEAIW
ncbi:MAG: metallophosphoesterase family protein [Desulfobacter sp.]